MSYKIAADLHVCPACGETKKLSLVTGKHHWEKRKSGWQECSLCGIFRKPRKRTKKSRAKFKLMSDEGRPLIWLPACRPVVG